jgi:hypothetical protein
MQMIAQSYRGVSLVVELSIDRFLVPMVIVLALTAAGMLVGALYEGTIPGEVIIHQP